MPQKKSTSIFRINLVTIGIGQGQIETLPYLFSKTEYNYKGETSSQSSYTPDGLLTEKVAWEYNDQGKIITAYYYTEPDEPSETISYKRNEKGLVIKDEKKYIDGSLDTTVYRYNEENQLIEKITTDEEGVTDMHEKLTWEGKYLVKHEVFDAEDNCIALDEYVYDQKGNITEHVQVNEETGENRRTVSGFDNDNRKTGEKVFNEENEILETTTYAYDESGKLISASSQTPQKISSTLFSYDQAGNLLEQEEIDESGNQLMWVEHQYDDQYNRTSTTVFVNGGAPYNSQHYGLKYEYEWFEE
jgi:antitoxin component YwqK of YwqJK toxin-antitoxin module